MKRSSLKVLRPARLTGLCFLAITIAFLISNAIPWAARRVTAEHIGLKSFLTDPKAGPTLGSPAASANFTLNQYVYPGSATFSTLSPSLTPSVPPINSWSIGVPIIHVITIGNSNPSQTALVDITLKDDLAGGLGANFVVLDVKCDAFNGAACSTSLPAPGSHPAFAIPNLKLKVGNSNDIVIRILGYYTALNTFQNTFSIFETANPTTTEEQGPAKNVLIKGDWAPIDLALRKTGNTSVTSVSSTSAATIHYQLILDGDSSRDFYPGSALRIQDTLIANYPPLVNYSISNFNCTSVNGSTCPPAPANPGISISGGNSYGTTYLIWPAGWSTVIKKGDVITMNFDVDVKTTTNCGSASLSIKNQGALTMSGFTYSDANNSNNSAITAANNFTTGLLPCPPPIAAGTITKKRVCPTSGCPAVNWGDTVSYQVDVKNNTSVVQAFQVRDYVSKQSITVPLRASLAPSGVPADVHCTPATVVCTTTPATLVPPQDVILDAQSYQLFQTDFTLQPTGSPGDSVALTFDVRIDKLYECQTDPGNFFDNVANLTQVLGQGNLAYVGGTPAVTVKLPDLPVCKLNVQKKLIQPTNGITFGQPVSYTITYENLDSQPITVHTLRDALNMRDNTNANPYGNIPITNLSASCTSTTGVSPMPIYQLGATQIVQSYPDWQGTTVIQEASMATGITFPGNSKLQCSVSFTPHEPSATDGYCKGAGQPEIANSAFISTSGLYYYGTKPVAPFFSQATAPLPLCRSFSVFKSNPDGITSVGPNGLLTFQIVITNQGTDPASYFVLKDPMPAGFTYVSGSLVCAPVAACAAPDFVGDTMTFNAIPGTSQAPQNTVTLTFQVHASLAGGTATNTATGSFLAGPAGTNFYFEGDPAVVLVNSAQVQVLTPTLSKSSVPNTVVTNGSSVLTFTVTNQTSDPAQTGIRFTDLLPSGVTVTSAPATACGGTVSISGGNTITFANGTLGLGQHSCQFSVNVKATGCGAHVNNPTNFSQVSNLDVTNAHDTLTVTGCDGTPTPTPTPSDQSCAVATKEISCKADSSGGYLYDFTVTNNTGDVVHDILLTPPANSNFTLSQQQFSLLPNGLASGASLSLQVTINGGQPLEKACFVVTFMTTNGACCSQWLCPVLPECCAVATDEGLECNKDGTYIYTLSLVNTGVQTIKHFYLIAPNGVTVTPDYFPVSLKPHDTFTTKVTIKGGKPGDRLCFGISLHTEKMESCCTGEHCIVLPECTVSGVP